jgi:hypothetical protein
MNTARSLLAAGVLALLLLSGCPGKVTFDELEKFGSGQSAIWVEMETKTAYGSYTSHYLVLANKPGLCKTMQTALQQGADMSDEAWSSLYDGNGEDFCDAYGDYVSFMAAELDKFIGPGANNLTMSLAKGNLVDGWVDYDWGIEPEDGTYSLYDWDVDEPGLVFDASVTYHHANAYQIMADSMLDEFDYWYGCWDYYASYDDMDDASEMYWTDGGRGEAQITLKGANKVRVVFNAALVGEDGDDAGTMDGSFTATYCPVEVETDYGFYLYF